MKQKYTSCEIIEHGFDAQFDSINLCCRVCKENYYNKLVLFPNYKGEKINWNDFFKVTDELRETQKRGETVAQCLGCIYLEEKEWDDEHYIKSININNWIKCNAECIYCDKKQYKHVKEYKIYPLIKDLIKNNYLHSEADITIAGGEPTISNDFNKTIKALIKNKISPVRILTNAIKYNKYIENGLKEGLVNILVSTDSGTKETYKKIKQVNKHKEVWKNIAKYAKFQKIDSLVKTKYILIPLVNDNRKELEEFILRNKEAGIKYSCIDVEIGWFCRNYENKEKQKELIELFNWTKEFAAKEEIELTSFDRMTYIIEKTNTLDT